jgi:hypothetical protein
VISELKSPIEITRDFPQTKSESCLSLVVPGLSANAMLIVYPKQPLVHKGKKKNKEAGTISFTISRPSYPDASELVRVQAQLATAGASGIENQIKAEGMVGHLSDADKLVEQTAKTVEVWKVLLKKVGIIVEIGDQIAEASLD